MLPIAVGQTHRYREQAPSHSCTAINSISPPGPRTVALRMAQGIASVAAHLHRHGITHGDLYGHNILWNEVGDCLLGDFGAASFHATTDTLETRALQRLEVRAFGVLLGELLERVETGLSGELLELQKMCCQPDVLARPSFEEINALLASIQHS